MKAELFRLQRAVGSSVRSVKVDLLFDDSAVIGTIGHVTVEVDDSQRFFLSCAGDGSIFMGRLAMAEASKTTGFESIARVVAGMEGVLKQVTPGETTLHLTINDRTLKLENYDDELLVMVDDAELPADFFQR